MDRINARSVAWGVPEGLRERVGVIATTVEAMSRRFDDEFRRVCLTLLGDLVALEPFPMQRGREAVWAGAVVHAVGTVNGVYARGVRSALSVAELTDMAACTQPALSTRSRTVRSLLGLGDGDMADARYRHSRPGDLVYTWRRVTAPAPAPWSTRGARTGGSVHQLKVTMRGIRPAVWRRVVIASTSTLAEVHEVIQAAFGWTNSHLHDFEINGEHYGSPTLGDVVDEGSVRMADIAPAGTELEYTYDFGDSWAHRVVVERVGAPQAGVRAPAVTAGKRACPPEDCGGPWVYSDYAVALADPDHPEHEDALDVLGEEFEPERVGLERFEARLELVRQVRAVHASLGV